MPMRCDASCRIACFAAWACAVPLGNAQLPAQADPVAILVGHLDLEKYKATIKGLTQFGDRRQGTERNRKALDWIEAQLKSHGCTNTERLQFQFTEPVKRTPAPPLAPRAGGPAGQGGATLFGKRAPTGVNTDAMAQPNERLRALNAEPTPEGTSNGLIQLFGQASVVFVYIMEALKTSDGSFTPSLLLAIGLLVISALLVTQMKDPQKLN